MEMFVAIAGCESWVGVYPKCDTTEWWPQSDRGSCSTLASPASLSKNREHAFARWWRTLPIPHRSRHHIPSAARGQKALSLSNLPGRIHAQ